VDEIKISSSSHSVARSEEGSNNSIVELNFCSPLLTTQRKTAEDEENDVNPLQGAPALDLSYPS